jgi:hypothetical protein
MEKNEQGKWIIATAEDLVELQRNPKLWNDHFVQTADIDMKDVEEFLPIGFADIKFNGSYEGNANFIRNLKINCPTTQCVGLFGWTDEKANIQSVLLSDCKITGADAVGGIVGFNEGGRIEFCSASGVIEATMYFDSVGSICGCSCDNGIIQENIAECNMIKNKILDTKSVEVGYIQEPVDYD